MPLFSYLCCGCGKEFDEFRHVAQRNDPAKCACGRTAHRTVERPALVRDDPTDWRGENGGRGRYITQLQTSIGAKRDDHAYCRSRQEALDKARRRGDRAEIVG
jgi:putative FmdB family regulatory protein